MQRARVCNRAATRGSLRLNEPTGRRPRVLSYASYFAPTMMIVKEPGTVAPPRPPAGGVAPGGSGAASAAIANRWPVLLSYAMVRAPFDGQVFRFCSTSKLVGLFSLTMVIVPLPCVLKASIVDGLNAAP